MLPQDTGLISAEKLNFLIHNQNPRLKILDASYSLDSDPYELFLKRRIPGAAFFSISQICDHSSPLPHMLPSPEEFERHVAALGVSNDDIIVVYGQSTVMGPPRAWWMFRTFGHNNVYVLDGGLPEWMRHGYPVNEASPCMPAPGVFRADLRDKLVVSLEDMKQACREGLTQIYDARPPDRFSGKAPEPRPGLRLGHLPGSGNIPANSLADQATGKMKSPPEIESILEKLHFKAEKPVIATCGSGVTACMIALALYGIGKKDVSVYDGSWAEWGLSTSDTAVSINNTSKKPP